MARHQKYLKIGKQTYALKSDRPITKERKEFLQKHPQAQSFYFKSRYKMYWWYVKSRGSGSGMSVTNREQNKILAISGYKYLNKKEFID